MIVRGLARPRPASLMFGMAAAAAFATMAYAQAPMPAPADMVPADMAPIIANASLPRDLSPWGMFLNADVVVKVVMVGLVFASLVTWTVWLAKNLELWRATRSGRAALAVLNEARSLSEANARLGSQQRGGGATFANGGP